jgi:dolichyl-phosphate beta-glucosyltransferase
MFLSVIIPAYNEEKRIPKTLAEVGKYLSSQPYEYEIIVINDGSKDKTAEVVKNLQSQIKNLVLIDNKENHGKGFVTRQALLSAKGEIRLFMDADNATSIDQVERMLPYFKQGFDIAIGSRDVKESKVSTPQPLYRIVLGEGFNLMVQVLAGLWGIWDSQCGFKGLTAKATNDILTRCTINRWAFDPEILAVGKKLGYKIKEFPVIWVNDPESKVKMSSIFKMAIDLLVIRWNLIIGKYGRKS